MATTISYNGESIICNDGETLLKAFLRQRVKVPFSCGGGICHICMHKCISGDIPPESQKTLRQIYKDEHYVLLCKCIPTSDMQIELPDRRNRFYRMNVDSVNNTENGMRIFTLTPFTDFKFKNGQFVNVIDEKGARQCGKIVNEPNDNNQVIIELSCQESAGSVIPESATELEIQGPFDKAFKAIDMEEGLKREFPEPDPELWAALNNGKLLIPILKEFYQRVFADPLLGHFFTSTTQQRLVEKQYNFLHQAITGEKVFFGERPRNSHHWMVISNELFDHREKIHAQVFREFGVSEEIIKRLENIDNMFRADIVKDKAWPKVLFGKTLPLDGFESLVLDSATLCDSCNAELNRGIEVFYHVRTGKIYCPQCNGKNPNTQ